jgi:hypothetical protein
LESLALALALALVLLVGLLVGEDDIVYTIL